MHTIRLKDDYIKLGQALKAAGVVESGVDAKFAVQDGLVKVNGQTETQRGKKLVSGDKVEYSSCPAHCLRTEYWFHGRTAGRANHNSCNLPILLI